MYLPSHFTAHRDMPSKSPVPLGPSYRAPCWPIAVLLPGLVLG